MRIAIVGCGFVADQYLITLPRHPHLVVAGVYDHDSERATRFAKHHGLTTYDSFEELLADGSVHIVVNLTNPKSHFEVSKHAIESGKHVYSEKPLALELSQAKELVDLAAEKGVQISSAPCTSLSPTAQTMVKAMRDNRVGKVRLVYAEMDDGLVHKMPYRKWQSASGNPWPYKDEFEVGCTLEHAGYCLTWLAELCGPAESVTAFSSVQIDDKLTEVPLERNAPDFSLACIKFENGIVARLTCSIIAPHDHHLRVIGDEGILWTEDTWLERSPVYLKRYLNIRRKMLLQPWKTRLSLVGTDKPPVKYPGASRIDFANGIAELADGITRGKPGRLSAAFCLHVNELALAIHNAGTAGSAYRMTTRFDPVH